MPPSPHIEAPLDPRQLAQRRQAMCADPTFDDMPGKVELNEWGEVLTSQVGTTHGLMAMRAGEWLRANLGGHTMAEVGVLTAAGLRAPGVAWCFDAWLASHTEEATLAAAHRQSLAPTRFKR